MIKRYEKAAVWANGLSFLAVVAAVALLGLAKHRLDPLPVILLTLGGAGVISSCFYRDFKPKVSAGRRKQELLEAVHFYRSLGFFSQYGALPDVEVAARLSAELRKLGGSFDPAGSDAEPELLSLDETRVWNSDLECDVCEQNHVYSDIVKSIGTISRGAFAPQNISETWEADNGPIRVEFSLNGLVHTLRPKYRNDWLDTDFLFELANHFKGTGFELIIRPGDPVYATVLTEDEKRRIRRERGSVF